MVDIDGPELTVEDREIIKHPLTGGVILFARNYHDPVQLRELVRDIHRQAIPAPIIAVDQEGGRVQRFRDHFTPAPPMRRFGEMYELSPERARQAAEDCGWVMGCEVREVGIDLNFAPVVDLDYGHSEVIGDRAFHRETRVVAELAQAFAAGLRSAGVAACIKHFPGHGAVTGDSHDMLPCDQRAWQEVERDLQPFASLINAGIEAVMTAHLTVPCRDGDTVSFSSRWVTEILRGDLGFEGIVFSDDLSMKGADIDGGIVTKVKLALAAGCDFLPICNDRDSVSELYSSTLEREPERDFSRLRLPRQVNTSYKKSMRYETFVKSIQD